MKQQQITERDIILLKRALRLGALLFAVIFTLSGFEHYEKTGKLGMTCAYIVIGILALGWACLSFLDERRERIRKEKIEDAERIAKILSAPLDKYEDRNEAVDKVIRELEKKYK